MRESFFVLILIALSTHSQAWSNTNELRTQLESQKKLQLTMGLQAYSSLHEFESVDHVAETQLTISPSYKLSESLQIRSSTALAQRLTGSQKSSLSNTKVTLRHKLVPLAFGQSLIPSLGIRLPTQVEDRNQNTYNGSLFIDPTLISPWEIGTFHFTSYFTLSASKNFHTYDRGASGAANVSHSLSQALGIEKSLSSRVSFILDGEYFTGWTYQNSFRSRFSLGQSLSYRSQKNLTFSIGHSNSADALKSNGQDFNISLLDENTSVIYSSLQVVY